MNAQLKDTAGHLLPLVSINAVEVFANRTTLDELLQRIRAETVTLVPDLTTEGGRKLIASTAYKVARSKTALDDAGKALVEDWKRQAKVVDAERKHARDTLDALKDEIRAPLDEWEAEEARKEQVLIEEARIRREQEEAARLADIERRESALREHEERLAAEQAARDQAARDERIRQEAAAKAERDAAEAVQRAERQAAEAIEAARRAAEQADRDRIAAQEAAAAAQARAVQEAEQRAAAQHAAAEQARADEAARLQAEQERREANRRHVGAINRKAAAALVGNGVDEVVAKTVITLIAAGKVPAVSIAY